MEQLKIVNSKKKIVNLKINKFSELPQVYIKRFLITYNYFIINRMVFNEISFILSIAC